MEKVQKVILERSDLPNKKYKAILYDKQGDKLKTVQFGYKQDGQFASDYTIHKDEERKERYVQRHEDRERQFWRNKNDSLFYPSYWSRYLTWEKKTIPEAIKSIEQKQGVQIINKI